MIEAPLPEHNESTSFEAYFRDPEFAPQQPLAWALSQRQDLLDGALAAQSVIDAHTAHDPYDLVLLDEQMPTLDGLEAAQRIADAGLAKPGSDSG